MKLPWDQQWRREVETGADGGGKTAGARTAIAPSRTTTVATTIEAKMARKRGMLL